MTMKERDKLYEEAHLRGDYAEAVQVCIDYNKAQEALKGVNPNRHYPKDPYKYCC